MQLAIDLANKNEIQIGQNLPGVAKLVSWVSAGGGELHSKFLEKPF